MSPSRFWHGREDVEGVASGRGQRRIGRGRPMQIKTEVRGELLAIEDVREEFAIARAEQDRVMGHVRILAPGSEVPDEQAVGIACAFYAPIRPALAHFRGQQIAIRPCRVGIGDDDVGRDVISRGEHHTRRGAVLHRDRANLRAAPHDVPLRLDQPHEPLHQLAGPPIAKRTPQRRSSEGIRL